MAGRPLEKTPVSLSEAIAVAMRFGHLLDFPEHPNKSRPQADDDAQKKQRQARCCEHVDHVNQIQTNYNPDGAMQAAYRRRAASKKRPRCKRHQGRVNRLYLTGPHESPAIEVGSSISRRPGPGDSASQSASAHGVVRCSSHQRRNRNRRRRSPDSRSRTRNHRGSSRSLQIRDHGENRD
jgi:hypothetical protein